MTFADELKMFSTRNHEIAELRNYYKIIELLPGLQLPAKNREHVLQVSISERQYPLVNLLSPCGELGDSGCFW